MNKVCAVYGAFHRFFNGFCESDAVLFKVPVKYSEISYRQKIISFFSFFRFVGAKNSDGMSFFFKIIYKIVCGNGLSVGFFSVNVANNGYYKFFIFHILDTVLINLSVKGNNEKRTFVQR